MDWPVSQDELSGWLAQLVRVVPDTAMVTGSIPANPRGVGFCGAYTLPDETPPDGKIHPLSKMAVIFEPIRRF